MNTNTEQTTTHSYYAATQKQPDGAVMVTGWYDVTNQSAPGTYPDLSTLVSVSPEDWQRQYTQSPRLPWQIGDGKLTAYTPPAPVVPLKQQAQAAVQKARQQFQDLQMMGETFGAQMQAYMKALNAIITGTDTTSTALPTAPSDPTT